MKLEFYEFSEDLICLRNELKQIFPYIEKERFTIFQTNKFTVRIADVDEYDIELLIRSHSRPAKILIFSAGEEIDFDVISEFVHELLEDVKEIPCCLDFVSKYLNQ